MIGNSHPSPKEALSWNEGPSYPLGWLMCTHTDVEETSVGWDVEELEPLGTVHGV